MLERGGQRSVANVPVTVRRMQKKTAIRLHGHADGLPRAIADCRATAARRVP